MPYSGRIAAAVANLPTTHTGPGSLPTVPGSLRTITAQRPDFIVLNEVSRAPTNFLTRHAAGYRVTKGIDTPLPKRGRADDDARRRLANAVLWRERDWKLVDSGQFLYVQHDLVVFKGRPVDWDRHAVWTVLRHRADGTQVVVVAAHHMTNPEKQRRTHGDYAWPNRIAQYRYGMTLLRQLVRRLAAYGPVLLAGDMNVHPPQGSWSAPDQMAAEGYRNTRDRAVIYQFFPTRTDVVATRLVRVSSDHPHALVTRLRLIDAGTAPAAAAPLPSVRGFDAEQVRIAAAVVAAGRRLGLTPRGIAIGLMSAYGESGLRNLDHGDRDSIGVFQQRGNGAWGTTADRMDPGTAATNFFTALRSVPGWERMAPTLAAHAVQRNADPRYYARFWPGALRLYEALEQVTVPLSGAQGTDCPVLADGALGSAGGGFSPSGRTYVGPFPPAQLMARAQAFVAARTVDPYFHTVDGSWYYQCQHFAANLSGRANSGFKTAAIAWAHFIATDAAHPASAADGHSPPIGAWLYFKGSGAAGHVTVHLGQGLSASTDLPVTGRVGIVPVMAPVTEWGQTYMGWAEPWATPGTGSRSR